LLVSIASKTRNSCKRSIKWHPKLPASVFSWYSSTWASYTTRSVTLISIRSSGTCLLSPQATTLCRWKLLRKCTIIT
jgi:hypothetical protein